MTAPSRTEKCSAHLGHSFASLFRYPEKRIKVICRQVLVKNKYRSVLAESRVEQRRDRHTLAIQAYRDALPNQVTMKAAGPSAAANATVTATPTAERKAAQCGIEDRRYMKDSLGYLLRGENSLAFEKWWRRVTGGCHRSGIALRLKYLWRPQAPCERCSQFAVNNGSTQDFGNSGLRQKATPSSACRTGCRLAKEWSRGNEVRVRLRVLLRSALRVTMA